MLSELYLMSCVLKRYEDEGSQADDLPLLEWNIRNGLFHVQTRIDEVLNNLPCTPRGLAAAPDRRFLLGAAGAVRLPTNWCIVAPAC